MKTLKRILICFIILIVCSCSKKDPLIGTWEFVRIDTKNMDRPEKYDEYSLQSVVTFSSDHSFILMNKGNDPLEESRINKDSISEEEKSQVYFGTWSVEDSILSFIVHNSKKKQNFTSKIFSNDEKNMILSIPKRKPFDKKDLKFKYKKTDYDDVNLSEYKFTSQELNKWRQKSTKKQTKQEIKARTENALTFFINFLEYHDADEKLALISYMEPSPFKYFGNGIMLKKQQNCESWNSLFYDKEDAQIAYSMLEQSFDSVAKIPEEISKNPIKINIYILKEILKNLKSQ